MEDREIKQAATQWAYDIGSKKLAPLLERFMRLEIQVAYIEKLVPKSPRDVVDDPTLFKRFEEWEKKQKGK